MKRVIAWSTWSIAAKILTLFLGLSVISMGVVAAVAIAHIRDMGRYALETSTSLGERAIRDSTAHLNALGEDIVHQKAVDVAKQVEMYLRAHPAMTRADMRDDAELRGIVVQPVGTSGYTALVDPVGDTIVIHKFPEQEKTLSSLQDILPSFWALLRASATGTTTSGYYDWMEVNGSISQKYATIVPVTAPNAGSLTLWATTYITEFSLPVEQTKQEIGAAIQDSSDHISRNVSNVQGLFLVILTALVITVVGLALLLSRVITSPIQTLKRGTEAIGRGNLGHQIAVGTKDELGDLANSFNQMSSALYTYTDELKKTAEENLAQEKVIENNLRLYMRQVGQAQEAERKRVARELHDDTAQALVVVARHLDDWAAGNPGVSAQDIRREVGEVLEGVRRFSQELRPSILDDLGLIPAVKWLASDLTRSYGIPADVEITGSQRPLAPESELMLFRIVQEALTNVRKHSHATKVVVGVDFADRNVRVSIQDNGTGFDVPVRVGDFTRMGKLGLTGMEERVQLLGGVLKIDSLPGGGTVLTVEVPT